MSGLAELERLEAIADTLDVSDSDDDEESDEEDSEKANPVGAQKGKKNDVIVVAAGQSTDEVDSDEQPAENDDEWLSPTDTLRLIEVAERPADGGAGRSAAGSELIAKQNTNGNNEDMNESARTTDHSNDDPFQRFYDSDDKRPAVHNREDQPSYHLNDNVINHSERFGDIFGTVSVDGDKSAASDINYAATDVAHLKLGNDQPLHTSDTVMHEGSSKIDDIIINSNRLSVLKETSTSITIDLPREGHDMEKKVVKKVEKQSKGSAQTLSKLFLSVKKVVNNLQQEEEEEEEEEDDEGDDDNDDNGKEPLTAKLVGDAKVLSALADLERSPGRGNGERAKADTPMFDPEDVDEDMAQPSGDLPMLEQNSGGESEDEEDEEDLEDAEEPLPPTHENLEYLNNNYKDYLSNLLTSLTKELQRNQTKQLEIELLLQDKEDLLSKTAKSSSNQHVSVTKKTLSLFGYPYFKDIQMYHPPPNKDTQTKRSNNELDVWVEYPRSWSNQEVKVLTSSVRKSGRYNLLYKTLNEKDILEHRLKEIGLVDEDRQLLEDQLSQINKRIREVSKIPDDKLLEDRFEEFDWMKIAATNLKMSHSPKECRLYWRNLAHVTINKSPWTSEEDNLLKRLAAATECREWDSIAKTIDNGRTSIACYTRFMQKHFIISNHRSWTPKEDNKLLRLVAHCRVNNFIPWTKVSYYMERRTKEQCYQRYSYSIRENIRHGSWHPSEEWTLIMAHLLYGNNWAVIAEILYTRSAIQSKCHWIANLKFEAKPWTMEEDIVLLEGVLKHGLGDWVSISKLLNESRTRTRCRQRFEIIYKLFKRNPEDPLDQLSQMDSTNRTAHKRQKVFNSLDEKFHDWLSRMDEETVVSNNPLPRIDLEAETVLPSGASVKNRILSRFVRHLQTLLPPVECRPLDPLPQVRRRMLPDDTLEPLALRPLSIDKLTRQQQRQKRTKKRKGRAPVVASTAAFWKKGPAKTKNVGKTPVDRDIERLFRPSYLQNPGRYKVNYSPEDMSNLLISTRNLEDLLQFSSLKSNLDPDRFNMFSAGEQKLLEHWMLEAESPVPESSAAEKRRHRQQRRKKTYSRKGRGDHDEEQQEEDTETHGDTIHSLVMPNKSTLLGWRGSLLHADYTAELAWEIEPDPTKIIRRNTFGNAHKILRMAINNPDLTRRSNVGDTLFSLNHQEDDTGNREQLLADERLVERLIKLFYWPAKMSATAPAEQEVLFLGDEEDSEMCSRDSAVAAVDNPFVSSSSSSSHLPVKLKNQERKKLVGVNSEPGSSNVYPSIPSVGSVYSDAVCSPATPVTKTYSRKRSGPKLGISFNDLISKSKKIKQDAGGRCDEGRWTSSTNVDKPPPQTNFSSNVPLGRIEPTNTAQTYLPVRLLPAPLLANQINLSDRLPSSPLMSQNILTSKLPPPAASNKVCPVSSQTVGGRKGNVRVIDVGRSTTAVIPRHPVETPSNVQVIHVISPSPRSMPVTSNSNQLL